jgi:hypothetical protein
MAGFKTYGSNYLFLKILRHSFYFVEEIMNATLIFIIILLKSSLPRLIKASFFRSVTTNRNFCTLQNRRVQRDFTSSIDLMVKWIVLFMDFIVQLIIW